MWLAEAQQWIHAQLVSAGARAVGELEQRSVQPWSTVLVVPTDLGDVYFKANGRGDACVSHPFFSMSVTLEGVIAWGVDDVRGAVAIEPFRDAFLAPFARDLDGVDLVAACSIALRLGWVCRAVNAHRKHGHAGPEAEHTRVRLRLFLDGDPNRLPNRQEGV
jgi:hypothetical protein